MSLKASLNSRFNHMGSFVRRNYATIIMVIIFFCVFGLLGYAIDGQRSDQKLIERQNEQLNEVIKNQKNIQAIGEDVIFLADRGIFYNKCVARLFVEYTQDQQPIELENLTKCDFVVLDEDGEIIRELELEFNPTLNGSRQNTESSAEAQSTPKKPNTTQNAPEQPQEDNRGTLQRITDWLGDLL